MGMKCDKCMTQYDDTWGVCLFCGDELSRGEKCDEVCRLEGDTPENAGSRVFWSRVVLVFITMFLFVGIIVYFLMSAGGHVWSNIVERMLYKG